MKQTLVRDQESGLQALLYLPPNYDKLDKWPLLLFLHGAGERGDDPVKLLDQPLPKMLETDDLPFVVIAPQCPQGVWWTSHLEPVKQLLRRTQREYKIDPRRVYLTGISMGAYGSWQLAMEEPRTFAAVVPICGGWPWYDTIKDQVCRLKDTPIWAFHGAEDDVVGVNETISMVEALKACGGDPRMTIYPDLKHDAWTVTYANKELYEWMLQHATLP